ncbi:unnamed protein product [Protopolystoma xenopodis]|uniref:Uncharacterized protein n=1 Tax=Protopolystoma xenopodis TaxID=117903 RepID=A0A448WX20_9PLAT|nr:unnamed protein product [Protopolystoma xenopodis]
MDGETEPDDRSLLRINSIKRKSIQTDTQTDANPDGRTDGRTDGREDTEQEIAISPSLPGPDEACYFWPDSANEAATMVISVDQFTTDIVVSDLSQKCRHPLQLLLPPPQPPGPSTSQLGRHSSACRAAKRRKHDTLDATAFDQVTQAMLPLPFRCHPSRRPDCLLFCPDGSNMTTK